MKTLSSLALLAAVSAFCIFPTNFETVASILFSLGFASIILSDYNRQMRRNEARLQRVPVAPQTMRRPAHSPFGLAA